MKELLKDKKTWIAIEIIVVIAWSVWSGQPTPEVTQ
jgi:hypothetical protein